METEKFVANPYAVVDEFEWVVSRYAGSKFAVAVDSGTSALFLCCKYLDVGTVCIPKRTYISVPMAVIHAGGKIRFTDNRWEGYYSLDPYPIIDSTCRFRAGMHVPSTFRCLSFDYKKHLPIGRGGMILTDDPVANEWFRAARSLGRDRNGYVTMVGWKMNLPIEDAIRGMSLMDNAMKHPEDLAFWYEDLSEMDVWDSYISEC